ncbi:MAG: 30S ribosomal protein S13 [Candidatus Woykebacteria bacterium RIFCSPHIGHO2_12_FULL_43_10]|uniref:Small ribosomal subunit protein uS13 n=2 Tax=Candidatus Woykeibacteriota TaxID=1817899 RepID=A0A1G1WXH8_9BACT|nr:MAG: 30S ribosomal protein S13 [Candidatus Woykebacteria bacterium RIFCSPHIGHO2_01_FULL_43_29]OGY28717.1 MAG: 30S ribosomal protein S13 [Candidatus Woykebacteria bacterium RIFCSPHIGHO2_02_FULL_43_16b]OGY29792.1 MAG: 30S ribosomal protein S13 [Candidatus Woykebacteria bacterium RIFCSPHIGHO2_12_FULL_43_10]OGY32466.1 MAG: 30S ribosomal protein S13 [Candidatus Woykebacteria bacterium RIFCSPLOWO2_01_FULL_43_14]
MARIAGVELPQNKKVLFALPYIYGLGLTLSEKITEATKIDPDKRVKDLTEDEVIKLQKEVEKYEVEGDLRRLVIGNIRRLEDLKTYRGRRHQKGLPVNGQRTRSNARTKRGKRVTIGAMKKDAILKMEASAKTKAPATK